MKKTKMLKSIALAAVTSILLLGLTGCPTGTSSSGSGSGGASGSGTSGSGTGIDIGSVKPDGKGFVVITPPSGGIAGVKAGTTENPTGGTDDYWKGVFIEGRTVTLSPYALAETEVPYSLWREVYNWAIKNGYKFENGGKAGSKGTDNTANTALAEDASYAQHPVTTVSWRDVIVWCNAYTEKTKGKNACVYRVSKTDTTVVKDATDTAKIDAVYADMSKKGYRLPTEAEWEYAARYQGSTAANGVKVWR